MAPGDPANPDFGLEWPGGITVGAVDYGAYQTTLVPTAGSFVIHPNTHLEIGDGSNTYMLVSTVLIPTVDNPAGVLSSTKSINMPASDPLTFNLPGDSGNDYLLGGKEKCGLEEGDHVYTTLSVSVSLSGVYTFRYVSSDPASEDIQAWSPLGIQSDPYLAVYSSFDPANPDANVLSCDDDADLASQFTDPSSPWNGWIWTYLTQSGQLLSPRFPQFTSELAPGTYTLVLTSYASISAADWVAQNQGPVDSRIELWGPEGGYELPNTGVNVESGLMTSALAIFAGLTSILLVVWRRRARN